MPEARGMNHEYGQQSPERVMDDDRIGFAAAEARKAGYTRAQRAIPDMRRHDGIVVSREAISKPAMDTTEGHTAQYHQQLDAS